MANVHRILRYRRNRWQQHRRTCRQVKSFRRTRDFNPLEGLTEKEILERYKLSRETILFLLTMVHPHIVTATRRSMAVTPLLQLLVTLRFYATGAFWKETGDSVGLSAASVHRCVHKVSRAIVTSLASTYIKFPTPEESSNVKTNFYKKSGR